MARSLTQKQALMMEIKNIVTDTGLPEIPFECLHDMTAPSLAQFKAKFLSVVAGQWKKAP